jgi:hypothetical protein
MTMRASISFCAGLLLFVSCQAFTEDPTLKDVKQVVSPLTISVCSCGERVWPEVCSFFVALPLRVANAFGQQSALFLFCFVLSYNVYFEEEFFLASLSEAES